MAIGFQRGTQDHEEKRRVKRTRLVIASTVRERARSSVDAKISDLSPYGCRIEGFAMPMPGSQVWVRLPGLESQSAQVAWSQSGSAGVKFDQPLHPTVASRYTGDNPAAARHHTMVSIGASMGTGSGESASNSRFDHGGDALLSRREQIISGIASNDHSPLAKRKRPRSADILNSITRQIVRTVDHRRTERFNNFTELAGGALSIGGQPAEVLNLSSSGLRATIAVEAEIGESLPVCIEGFDPIPGRVVWMKDNEAGFCLPDDSFDLQSH